MESIAMNQGGNSLLQKGAAWPTMPSLGPSVERHTFAAGERFSRGRSDEDESPTFSADSDEEDGEEEFPSVASPTSETSYRRPGGLYSRRQSDPGPLDTTSVSPPPSLLAVPSSPHAVRRVSMIRRGSAACQVAPKPVDSCLGKAGFLKDRDPAFLEELSQHAADQQYTEGMNIIRQGDQGARMYIIKDGEVEIICNGCVVAKLGEGAVFGEMCLLTQDKLGARRNATVKAVGDVVCHTLHNQPFQAALNNHWVEKKYFMEEARRRLKELEEKEIAKHAKADAAAAASQAVMSHQRAQKAEEAAAAERRPIFSPELVSSPQHLSEEAAKKCQEVHTSLRSRFHPLCGMPQPVFS